MTAQRPWRDQDSIDEEELDAMFQTLRQLLEHDLPWERIEPYTGPVMRSINRRCRRLKAEEADLSFREIVRGFDDWQATG